MSWAGMCILNTDSAILANIFSAELQSIALYCNVYTQCPKICDA